jgi:methylaspartate mutase epsilon subunit
MELKNQRWSEEDFLKERGKVLSLWPTGPQIDLEESVEYLLRIPPERDYARTIVKVQKQGNTLVQPRSGVALVEEQIALLKQLQDGGGADGFIEAFRLSY